MPSTFSPSLRIELIGAGEQAGTWGTTTNTNLGTLVEASVAGAATVSVISANQALTIANGAADQARNAVLQLTTTTGAPFAIYAPPDPKQYTIYNASAHAATVFNSTVDGNTTAAGTGVTIPAGETMTIWSNGTNFRVQNSRIEGNITGNAATATTLQTARAINGTSFNGSADVTVPVNTTQKSDSVAYQIPFVTSVTAGNQNLFTDSAANITYNPSTNTLTTTTFAGALTGNVTGNATTATTLQTARNIGGVSFNGSADINLPGVNTGGNQNTTGSAATLTTARTINGTSFNGSANVTVPVNTTQKSDSVAYQIPFVTSVTAGNQDLFTDSAANITYNPSTNTLATTTFSGSLTGDVTGNLNGNLTAAAPTAATQSFGTSTTAVATTAFVQAALQALHPVGSIYINAGVTTNPATLLGFGTWVAFGAGRVMVGLNAGDALFDTLEETGGSKNATLVSHTHTATSAVTDPGHNHTPSSNGNTTGFQSGGSFVYNVARSTLDGGPNFTMKTSKETTGVTVATTVASTGSSATNANLQPYITVAMWKRTA
jgi:hypothetical protein